MKLLLTFVLLFSAAFGSVDEDIKTFVKDFRLMNKAESLVK